MAKNIRLDTLLVSLSYVAIVGHTLLYQMDIHDYLQKWTFRCKKAKAKIFENKRS